MCVCVCVCVCMCVCVCVCVYVSVCMCMHAIARAFLLFSLKGHVLYTLIQSYTSEEERKGKDGQEC